MDELVTRVTEAWLRAGEDLAIGVRAPFELHLASGDPVKFIAHVADFGAEKGTLVTSTDEWPKLSELAAQADYYSSGVNLEFYSSYGREAWIDTLNDWGWKGKGEPPSWYTGKSPWFSEPTAQSELLREFQRIFNLSAPSTEPPSFALLPFIEEDEILAFLRTVPSGVTIPEFVRLGVAFHHSHSGNA